MLRVIVGFCVMLLGVSFQRYEARKLEHRFAEDVHNGQSAKIDDLMRRHCLACMGCLAIELVGLASVASGML